jgi:DNA polymerase III delta prime subunit
MAANDKYKVSKILRDISEVIQFWAPSTSALKQYVMRINREERLNLPDDILTAASETKDFRAALNILESRQILQTKEKKISVSETITKLLYNENVILPESGSVEDIKKRSAILYHLDENAPKLYDILDMQEIFEKAIKADKYNKRGQISFANSILKELPKTTMEIEEIVYPVYYSKNKGKEEPT